MSRATPLLAPQPPAAKHVPPARRSAPRHTFGRRARSVFHAASLVALLLVSAAAQAQEPLFPLPGARVSASDGTIVIPVGETELRHVPGIGWHPRDAGPAPVVIDGRVFVRSETLDLLGQSDARLERIRIGQGETVRVVLDLHGVEATQLQRLRAEGRLAAGEALDLALPILRLPEGLPGGVPGLDVRVVDAIIRTNLELRGPAMTYNVFPLDEPVRLVIDLTPDVPLPAGVPSVVGAPAPSAAPPVPAAPGGDVASAREADARLDAREAVVAPPPQDVVRTLHPGATYRRTTYMTTAGRSVVDLVEITPGSGEFRVVGESFVPRTLSELSSGGSVGINASYFDTRNHQTIGLLTVDSTVLSLPSRNRASIGFGLGGPVIDRVQAQLDVRVNGRPAVSGNLTSNQVSLFTAPNQLVGSPTKGAIVVSEGRVLENRVGPRRVPADGYVLTYEPDVRELALVDAGDVLSFGARFEPNPFNGARYAVEAGPLLLKAGQPAFDPSAEAFDILDPNSNVNRRTTRAAVGKRPDGTVLFVTATNMTAAELVPLFQSLGAEYALQMDSGGSSTLFGGGQVLNRPATSQRPISTAIVWIPYR